jgi:hypothetical protein
MRRAITISGIAIRKFGRAPGGPDSRSRTAVEATLRQEVRQTPFAKGRCRVSPSVGSDQYTNRLRDPTLYTGPRIAPTCIDNWGESVPCSQIGMHAQAQ